MQSAGLMPRKGDRGMSHQFPHLLTLLICKLEVIVAMSGGVDSSVTAKLLAEQARHKYNSLRNRLSNYHDPGL